VSAGVKLVSVDVSKEEVLVESALTSAEVQALIEKTGRRAVLKGIGGSEQGEEQWEDCEDLPDTKPKTQISSERLSTLELI